MRQRSFRQVPKSKPRMRVGHKATGHDPGAAAPAAKYERAGRLSWVGKYGSEHTDAFEAFILTVASGINK